MNLTTKVQPKSVPAKVDVAKQIQAEAEIGCQMLESIYEPICYSEAVAPAMNNVRMARSVIKDITTCMESLEANGYSDVWMDTVNADGNFMNFLNLTPADLIGSEAHKKDVCMQGLMDSLKEWAIKIWDFIVKAYEVIMGIIKKSGFINDKHVEEAKKSVDVVKGWIYDVTIPDHKKFYIELPDARALNTRLEIIKGVVISLTASNVDRIIDGYGKPIDVINSFLASKYANIKHGLNVDMANGTIAFDPFVVSGIDIVKWVKENQDINIDVINLMNNLRVNGGCVDNLERVVSAAHSMAKIAAAAAKKSNNTTKLADESARCARAQQLLNIINVLVTQVSIINNFAQLYRSKLAEVAIWIQQQKQPKP